MIKSRNAIILTSLMFVLLFLCSAQAEAGGKAGYNGSESCAKCHQRIYMEWRKTLHSQMIKDVSAHPDAMIGDFDSKSEVRTFSKSDVLYTIGNQWKQRYITKKGDELYILPAQYNLETGEWKPYNPSDWDKKPWLKDCGGCHVTGLDYDSRSFSEPGVGCEACHGPGKSHVEAKKEDYSKTIINPSTLSVGLQVQICGSCHTRGKDPSGKHGFPINFRPGVSLVNLYKPIPNTDPKDFWPNGHSKSHHQQYLDWQSSPHAKAGVSCVSCHTVHSTGSATRYQTRLPGDKLCLYCHSQPVNPKGSHSLHDMGSCIGCHMAKIVKSAESGDLHDHTFRITPPADSIKHGGPDKQPNSCSSCHYHSGDRLEDLQKTLEQVKMRYKKAE